MVLFKETHYILKKNYFEDLIYNSIKNTHTFIKVYLDLRKILA